MSTHQQLFRIGAAALAAGSLGAASSAHAQAFSAPVTDSVTLTFNDPVNPGTPVDLLAAGGSRDWDNNLDGEFASWGSFSGSPDALEVGVVAGGGEGGGGNNAARIRSTETSPGGWFARMWWEIKGLRLEGAGFTDGDGFEFSTLDATLSARVKTDISEADFRINLDSGSQFGGSRGNVPDLIDQAAPGSLVLNVSRENPVGFVPSPNVNEWTTYSIDLIDMATAGFNPFFSREPRANQLTRIGVTFPGGGQNGEILVDEISLSGPGVLKFHAADFNTDEMVDASDIDEIFAALAALELNQSLPLPGEEEELEWGVNQDTNANVTLAEKYAINPVNGVLDFSDIEYLVQNVLTTDFGDANLDGVVDAADQAIVEGNLGNAGGWADGDFTGDGVVDNDDLAFIVGGGLVGDLNGDGFVGAGDLDILLGVWNQNDSGAADLNEDGFIGAGDLDILLGNWNAGTAPGGSAGVVPEPASLALVGLGALGLMRRRR